MKFSYIHILSLFAFCSCAEMPHDARSVDSLPPLYPDYVGVTIPYNIAPLDFDLADASTDVCYVYSFGQDSIVVSGSNGHVSLDADEWSSLVSRAVNDSVRVSVFAKLDGQWLSYRPFFFNVSPDAVDPYLSYRLIRPGYQCGGPMKICTRALSSFHEDVVYDETLLANGCVNCHSFKQCDPSYFNMHVRGPQGATVIRREGRLELINTKHPETMTAGVYPYWHPSGRFIAYSNNLLRQSFYSTDFAGVQDPHLGKQSAMDIDVVDEESDVVILDVDNNQLIVNDIYCNKNVMENAPVFSPDGKYLYFISAVQKKIPQHVREIRFNLCRVDFDETTGSVGSVVDTLIHADRQGFSVTNPRPSYDGRFIVYSRSAFSYFQLYHEDADLWLYDISSGTTAPLSSANSTAQEGWHTWSSNSRWIVFSSKRDDGRYTRLYFTHVDEHGRCTKAFMLPQQHPLQFYAEQMFCYNVPEMSIAPVNLDAQHVARRLRSSSRTDVTLRRD